jgi:Flp pilus assembly CpaF family ATPase
MAQLEPLKIIVRGKHDTGKTTVANILKMLLEESGFRFVSVRDVRALPNEQKADFEKRIARNLSRPIHITVECEE